MDNMSDLQRMLRQLNAPYKKSTAYEVFGDVKQDDSEVSMFWNSITDYVVKYENAKIND